MKSHRLKLHNDVLEHTATKEDVGGNRGDELGETEMKEDILNEEHNVVSENDEPEEEVSIQENKDVDEEKTTEQEDKIVGAD